MKLAAPAGCVLTLAALWAGAAHAGPWYSPEMTAGYQGNTHSGHTFATYLSPSVDKRIVPIVTATLSYLYYRYPESAGETRVESPGGGLGVALRWRPDRLSASVGLGYEARYTTLRPAQGEASIRTDHGPSVTSDVYYQVGARTALAATGYYGFAQEYTWARVMARQRILPTEGTTVRSFGLGVDATAEGNAYGRGIGTGIFADVAFPGPELAVGVGVGIRRETRLGGAPALEGVYGVSVYHSF